jgi:hypothetical protein
MSKSGFCNGLIYGLSLVSAIADCWATAEVMLASIRKIANPGEQWAQFFKAVAYTG